MHSRQRLITSFLLTSTTLILPLVLLVILPMGCATAPSRVGNAGMKEQTESKEDQIVRLFEILDVNGDGKLSKSEAQSGFKYLIASYDRGGKTEILAAKPGSDGSTSKSLKVKSKRRPTSQDATRAFEALFVKDGGATETISKDEFKKLVVKASDNPETDPFGAFYE